MPLPQFPAGFSRLELLAAPLILIPCRFTSFIVTNANGTAKFWFAPAIGKERNARTAARQSWRKSFPSSRPPPATASARHRPAPARPAPAACAEPAGRIGIDPLVLTGI